MIARSWTRCLTLAVCLGSIAIAVRVEARPQQREAASPQLGALDAYIDKARADWQVPGAAVAIVKDDRVVYAKGFGVRETGKPGAVDTDTIFAIGSATKAFTGAALAMLVDDKKIAWDGVVHGYMPDFVLNDPYATANATVRDLLSHRTGYVSDYGWLWTGSGFDRDEIIRRLRFQTKSEGFRNHFVYANEIFTAAGEIVPAVTGTSWDRFVATRIFAPLGMTRSSTSVTALAGQRDVATPHGMADGKLTAFPYRRVDNVGGAGAINASVHDMAQWLRLQLGNGMFDGKRLISEAAIGETHTAQVVLGPGRLVSPNSKFAEYGFGWILGDYRGHKVVMHMGGVDGMMCIVAMIPDEHLGVVVLTNMLPHQLPTAVALKVFDTYLGVEATDWSASFKAEAAKAEAAAAAGPAPAKPAAAAQAALPLARYVGSYASALYGTATVTVRKGALVLMRPTADAILVPDGDNRFKARWTSAGLRSVFGDTPVVFTTALDGSVAALELATDAFRRESAGAPTKRR